MPRRHRHRKMRGGFLDSLSNWASSTWNSTKKATGFGDSSTSTSTYTPTQSYDTGSTTSAVSTGFGGRSRKQRKMRGGTKGYTPTTGLASHGASFSGPTAKPHTMVGGRTRKHHGGRKHRHSKSCKHDKH